MAAVYRSQGYSRVVVRGGARELYLDGTFASVYTPGQVRTGSVWDAIGASVLALPASRRRSVLLLGLGGASAARVIRAVAPAARIVAVELSQRVVELAREWFDLDELGLEVVQADARDYLARTRARFDAVLDDVFVGTGSDAVKPEGLPRPGLDRAAGRLQPGGIVASNALDEWRETAGALVARHRRVVQIRVEDYDNRVFVAGGRGLSARRLRRALAACPVLAPTLPRLRLRTVAP